MSIEQKKRKSGMVRVRGGFSELNRIVEYSEAVQLTEFDDVSRVRLSNAIYELIEILEYNAKSMMRSPIDGAHFVFILFKNLLNDALCVSNQIVDMRFDWRKNYSTYVGEVIHKATYNEVLDIIQFICQWFEERFCKEYKGYAVRKLNEVFEKEYIGYRFVAGKIVAITDVNELDVIGKACDIPFEGCRKHIQKAVGFLSDREARDYKNCIKESISAVESVCQIITGNSKATLGDALKNIETNGKKIHPSLSQAFGKLYGYASDQGGIRHAEGLMESSVTFEEAKFMLVSCSAFTNYLVAEYGKNAVQRKE